MPLVAEHVRLPMSAGRRSTQRIHVGNARPLIVFDVLFRLLVHLYPRVTYVRNITDVDDKIIEQARANGEPIEALTARTTAAFLEDTAALGCLEPTIQPKATEHIGEMVALIGRLIERGHAYAAEGHVLFSTPSMPAYGRLSGRNRDDQIAGARVEVAPYKQDPADFVLWKPAAGDGPGWPGPWGRGRRLAYRGARPWRRSISACRSTFMAAAGPDLPHHENEMARAAARTGWRAWPATGCTTASSTCAGQKMSKSLGNVPRLDDALAAAGEAIRLLDARRPLSAPIDCSESGRRGRGPARSLLRRPRAGRRDAGRRAGPGLIAALEDDLNTPKALAVLHELLHELNLGFAQRRTRHRRPSRRRRALLGLLESEPSGGCARTLDDGRIAGLVAERQAPGGPRDFARRMRSATSWRPRDPARDGPGGTTWRSGQ